MLTRSPLLSISDSHVVLDEQIALLAKHTGDTVTVQGGFAASRLFSPSVRADSVLESSAQTSARDFPVSDFWQSLTSGYFRLLQTTAEHGRCSAIARERTGAHASALGDRALVLLHRALQAEPQKSLAIGFDLSPAVVSQVLGNALEKLGMGRRLSTTPLPIVLASLGHCGVIVLPSARFTRFERQGLGHVALELPDLEPALLTQLSNAERKVAVLLSRGATYSEIAARRSTALRTVSNQIATLCRKLNVRGRFELVRYWALLQWGASASAE